ncbi:MAG: molybdopterin-dependent oxidoreductase [Anaerolineales bacterium]|nr:molybdopterin-dependent oxidoreductase [Anaerolineales bacterium]
MQRRNLLTGAFVGGLLTAVIMALMYLAQHLFDLAFVPFDAFNWMAGLLPGPVITFGIDLMIDSMRFLGLDVANSAKTAEQIMALGQYLVMGIVAGAVFFAVLKWQQVKTNFMSGLVLGALFGFPAIAISIGTGSSKVSGLLNFIWLLVVFLAWGVALVRSYARMVSYDMPAAEATGEQQAPSVEKIDRRRFLILLGLGSATITVIGAGLGALLASSERREEEAAQGDAMAHNTDGPEGEPFPNADAMVIPVPGTRPEYTPVKDHYQVFIELEPTEIDGSTWQLPITGMVDNPLMLTLDDFRNNYEPFNQYVTLSCISGRVGTSLISTTYWTGARVQDVLADAGVQPDALYLNITAGDGFYETVPLDMINADPRIMFCYAWDGNTLPVGHGFPLRIWLPDRFGMKQPKWITSIEVTDTYKEGYWVERNWSETAQVRTTSVIDTVAVDHIVERDGQMYVPVSGIAFSGDRGISKVEVSVDGGAWEEAQLRTPLSETTWVIWRYEWPYETGDHTFAVRCYTAEGELQVTEEHPARPDGSTGIHSVEETIS